MNKTLEPSPEDIENMKRFHMDVDNPELVERYMREKLAIARLKKVRGE